MKNVGCAIDFKYMTDYESANFHVPNSGYAGIKDRLDDNANTIIRNNDITVVGNIFIIRSPMRYRYSAKA